MKFELDEITVIAEPGKVIVKAREAVELARDDKTTGLVFLECGGVSVRVHGTDTPDNVRDKWRIATDFYGLTRPQRKRLYRYYVEEERTIPEAAKKAGVNSTLAGKYIKAKGWTRPTSHYTHRGHFQAMNNLAIAERAAHIREREGDD